MPRLILLANDHLMLWLPARAGRRLSPGALAEQIRAGGWKLPGFVYRVLRVPPNLRLDAATHGEVVVVRPERPLQERRPAPALTADQREVLRRMALGQTADQIALALSRRRRWVCYQMAEVRRKLGVTTRAAALRAHRRD
jgi:DNA-binding CsgD family transcriptional regulator